MERVDDLARRALATCWESARVKEASPLPTVDGQSWPEHVAQVLVALDASNLPWRLVAAGHLQRAADLIGRQRLSRSAFSFASNAVAGSHETLQQMIVGLLLDGARTFTDAATGTPAGKGTHDKKDAAAAPSDGNITDQRTAGPQRRATPSADRSGATDSPAISELSETLRTGLDRCSQHVQAVVRGVDSVLVHVPDATDGVACSLLADLCLQFDRARDRLDGVLATPGDPDALREAALQWSRALDEQVSTLAGIVMTIAPRDDQLAEAGFDVRHGQAVAAMVVKSVGNDLGAALVGFSDAVTVFWAALVATISAVETLLTVAVALADSPFGAPTAVALATTAVLRLSNFTTLTALMLAMADTAAGSPIGALLRRLVDHTAHRHDR